LREVIELDAPTSTGRGKVRRWLGVDGARGPFRRPYGIAWDGDDLLLADPDGGRVARVLLRGRATLSSEALFVQPIGIASCEAGIVVSDSERGGVALLDPELRLVRWLARDLARPTGVSCAGGTIYVTETAAHRVVVIEADGAIRHVGRRGERPGEFNFPTALAVHRNALFVADALNFRIQRLDAASGRHLGAFGRLGDAPGEMPRLKGIAVDRSEHLWVADAHLDQVALYDADGNFLIALGGPGTAPGEFAFPAGVAARGDGRIAVADSLNRRLQIFELVGAGAEERREES
jgi:DNA-binding beta-propeller fold protein YncE